MDAWLISAGACRSRKCGAIWDEELCGDDRGISSHREGREQDGGGLAGDFERDLISWTAIG